MDISLKTKFLWNAIRDKRTIIESEPYEKLAFLYDEIMLHVNYKEWANYVLRLANKLNKHINNITDLACGTGTLAINLAALGMSVHGFDGCEEMVRLAQKKQIPEEGHADFSVCDLSETPLVGKQDMVLCLYDSVNYLQNEEDFLKFIESAAGIITKEGILIFDCSTLKNSHQNFIDLDDIDFVNNNLVHRKAWFDQEASIQHNKFEIAPDDDDKVYIEHHKQIIRPINWFLEVLDKTPMKLIALYDGFSLKSGGEHSLRVHFVLEHK